MIFKLVSSKIKYVRDMTRIERMKCRFRVKWGRLLNALSIMIIFISERLMKDGNIIYIIYEYRYVYILHVCILE